MRINEILAVQQIQIATEQMKAKVDAEIKEPHKGVLVDVKA